MADADEPEAIRILAKSHRESVPFFEYLKMHGSARLADDTADALDRYAKLLEARHG